MKKSKICIIGPGIVGYSTGKALAELGHKVSFIGRNPEKMKKLRGEGFWTTTFESFPDHHYDFNITFITVATPTLDDKIDLKPLEFAAKFLGSVIAFKKEYHVIVVKSTVVPGTTEDLVIPIIEKYSGKKVGVDFGVCMNPEYLREKSSLDDSRKPWAILIGQYDNKSGDVLENIYKKFICPFFRCSLKDAEFQKYVHNLFNANKISFFNEMRVVGKKFGINTELLFNITALSCEGIWNPLYGIKDYGPFQGECLPKDTQAFLNWANEHGLPIHVLESVVKVNKMLLGNNYSRQQIGAKL